MPLALTGCRITPKFRSKRQKRKRRRQRREATNPQRAKRLPPGILARRKTVSDLQRQEVSILVRAPFAIGRFPDRHPCLDWRVSRFHGSRGGFPSHQLPTNSDRGG